MKIKFNDIDTPYELTTAGGKTDGGMMVSIIISIDDAAKLLAKLTANELSRVEILDGKKVVGVYCNQAIASYQYMSNGTLELVTCSTNELQKIFTDMIGKLNQALTETAEMSTALKLMLDMMDEDGEEDE